MAGGLRRSILLTIAAAVVVAMLVIGAAINTALREQNRSAANVSAAFENALVLGQVLRLAVDAETGQRGYLLTNEPSYLEPYTRARIELPRQLAALAAVGLAPPGGALQALSRAKLAELDQTVRLAHLGQRPVAMRLVLSGSGKQQLDALRVLTAAGVQEQRRQIAAALQSSNQRSSRIYLLLSVLGVCALALVVLGMLLTLRNVGLEAEARRLHAVEAAERQTQLVVRELSHRVKNLFSVVLAIVQLGGRGAATPADAITRIQSRIQALARAHAVSLGHELLQSADLAALLRATLSPYDRGDSSLELAGPQVELPTMRVTPLGMIMHELATNAVKYGAWRSPGGKVAVRWRVDAPTKNTNQAFPILHLEWEELCEFPLDDVAGQEGFGSRLFQAAVQQLDGRFSRERRPEGMRVTLDAPIVAAHPAPALRST